MTQTHIGYQTAKALKEFCPELPEPMDKHTSCWYQTGDKTKLYARITFKNDPSPIFAFQLHDLLSKPFCHAIMSKTKKYRLYDSDVVAAQMGSELFQAYYTGGLPAVEACLMKMIGGK